MKLVTSTSGKQFYLDSSWDDGKSHDRYLADLLIHYNMPATFYIPSVERELMDHQIKFLSAYFDIGGHTVSHRILTQRSSFNGGNEADIWTEINECKMQLENIIEKPVTNFCYPRGRYDQHVKELVKAAGFLSGRTTKVHCTMLPEDPFETHTTIHCFNRVEYTHKDWANEAIAWFDIVADPEKDNEYFHLWGHSWEINKYNDWPRLDKVLKHISSNIRT